MSELRTIRDRLIDGADDRDVDLGREPPDCDAAEIIQTTTVTTYPTTAAAFYAYNPGEVNGTEAEGGAATYVVDTSTILYALNLGTMIPPNGTYVLAHHVGGRTVFRYDG
jgi:hypothetical protein